MLPTLHTLKDMEDSLLRYLEDDVERLNAVERLQMKLREEHTYRHRVDDVLRQLSLLGMKFRESSERLAKPLFEAIPPGICVGVRVYRGKYLQE